MLTDAQCRSATCPPDKKRARFTDSSGLYLEVSPNGSKRWFWKTYYDGKEGRIALGSYPAVNLAAARKARDVAKMQKSEGLNPIQERKQAKLKASRSSGDTFQAIALEWYAKQKSQWSEGHAERCLRQLERDLFPWISAGFAGALLARTHTEGGGVHFVGDSSTGKTTLIEAAVSVWGGAGFKRSWRSTANGMEGAAAMFNDGLLALDEISECDPKDVGAIIYALGNGAGKQRASKSGAARGLTRWKCFIVSSGERTIETAMLEGGKAIKAGQGVRLLDIPTAQTYGAWEELHGVSSPATFSDAIKRSAKEHHGHAGRAFLERLTRDKQDFCTRLDSFKASPDFNFREFDGQEKRAAGRFALLALAGELATEYDVTGWEKGEALDAASESFKLWLCGRSGKGNGEQHQVIQQVAAFIERNGDGRFSDSKNTVSIPIQNRAGWWFDGDAGREYWFTGDGLREALKGHDFNRALDVLRIKEALPPLDKTGKARTVRWIGGRSASIYPINQGKLNE